MRFCAKCGNELKEGSRFCNICGTSVESNSDKKNAYTYFWIAGIVVLSIICLGLGSVLVFNAIKKEPVKDSIISNMKAAIFKEKTKNNDAISLNKEDVLSKDEEVGEKTTILVCDYSETFSSDGGHSIIIYDYDERGNRIEYTTYHPEEDIIDSKTIYEYDTENRCIKEQYIDNRLENLSYTETMEYSEDQDGLLVKSVYSKNGTLRCRYWFDGEKTIKYEKYDKKGEIELTKTSEYDEFGKLKEEVETKLALGLTPTTTYYIYNRIYDDNNNNVSTIMYKTNDSSERGEIEAIYRSSFYEDGKEKETTQLNSNKEAIKISTYNEGGYLIKEKTHSSYINIGSDIWYETNYIYKEIEVVN